MISDCVISIEYDSELLNHVIDTLLLLDAHEMLKPRNLS